MDLTWKPLAQDIRRKARQRGFGIARLTKSLEFTDRVRMFRSFVEPIFDYGLQQVMSASRKIVSSLQSEYNSLLKKVVLGRKGNQQSATSLRRRLKIKSLEDRGLHHGLFLIHKMVHLNMISTEKSRKATRRSLGPCLSLYKPKSAKI